MDPSSLVAVNSNRFSKSKGRWFTLCSCELNVLLPVLNQSLSFFADATALLFQAFNSNTHTPQMLSPNLFLLWQNNQRVEDLSAISRKYFEFDKLLKILIMPVMENSGLMSRGKLWRGRGRQSDTKNCEMSLMVLL